VWKDSYLAEIDQDELQTSTTNLYGMIHARYIVTASGLEAMVWYFDYVII